ncbi:MAG: hypothetical protein EHM21_18405, partial [Chloroflexi bacterium]
MPVYPLPAWLSRFVGREKEIAEIQEQISRTRLLTLTGPGGSGKTRLAAKVAAAIAAATAEEEARTGKFRDGVCFVELAAVQKGDLLPQSTLLALGLEETPGQPVSSWLVAHLRLKSILLVLDNCEHLVDACARFANALLGSCPDLHILATSREPLRITGEMIRLVPPLSIPEWQPGSPVEDFLRAEAVQLFADRARLVSPGLEINAGNAPAVMRICRQLDGMPLALELAAARANVLSLEEIAARMAEPARLLVNPDHLAAPRQQTMQAALDWSYVLLEPAEQRLFWQLSVFNGGFPLAAAEAVGAGDGIEPAEILGLLSRLVDKSLVSHQTDDTPAAVSRYRMLEVVRQYGLERLKAAGEELAIRRRHFDWCVELVQQASFTNRERGVWIARIEQELPNLRQAFAWSLAV